MTAIPASSLNSPLCFDLQRASAGVNATEVICQHGKQVQLKAVGARKDR